MKIRITNLERKAFANVLAERLGLPSEYKGAPTFAYAIGPYTVCRDNTVEVDDTMADTEMLREMTERGYLDGSWDGDVQMISISLPLSNHDGRSLTNLVRILACRQELINHAVGFDGFSITEELIKALEEEMPETADAFIQVMAREDVGKQKGFSVEDGKVHLEGFPHSQDPDKVKAYMNLASMINAMAIKQKRVLMEKPDLSNEKYSFRIWLLRLGMVGADYKKDREVLLSKLSGNAAFRTADQRDAFYAKLKEKRAEEKAAKGEQA